MTQNDGIEIGQGPNFNLSTKLCEESQRDYTLTKKQVSNLILKNVRKCLRPKAKK